MDKRYMFIHALQHGMPYNWTTNWIKPLDRGGDVNNVNNYQTIMVGVKYECIMVVFTLSLWTA